MESHLTGVNILTDIYFNQLNPTEMYSFEKIFKPAVSAAMAASLLACTMTDPENKAVVTAEDGMISVNVSVPAKGTRLLDIQGESNVNSLQVFVFSSDDRLEAYASGDGSSLTLDCTSGEKEFMAVTNAPSLESILTKSELQSAVSDLSDNSPSGLVMSGSVSRTLSGADTDVEIPVARLVARISVREITNGLSVPGYYDSSIELTDIYLSDVAGTCPYFGTHEPEEWINKLGIAEETSELLHSGNLSGPISHGNTYRTSHYFYCYPNPVSDDSSSLTWCPRFTRLVIATEIEGETYYYPIAIGNIEANHTYDIEHVQINRLGSDNPAVPVEVGSVSVSIKVMDWETGTVTDVTI